MKQVTIAGVKDFINEIEKGGLSLREEYVLACLRELVAVTERAGELNKALDVSLRVQVDQANRISQMLDEIKRAESAIGSLGWMSLDTAISLELSKLNKQISDLQEQVRLLTEQRDAVVVENAALKGNINKLENWPGLEFYSSAWEFHELDGFDASELICDIKTPATDAEIAALRAEAIPEGYALVPKELHLDADAVECICAQGGDGGYSYGEFTDVVLWVGDVENDDGSKTHGLNVSSADYPEEGSINIYEFAPQLRESKGEVSNG